MNFILALIKRTRNEKSSRKPPGSPREGALQNPGLQGSFERGRSGVTRDHTQLRAFELADQLACSVYQKTASFPKEEMFGLTSQLRRAAVSIASNIVEGSARQSKAEYLHFLDMAYGSEREVEYQIALSHRLGFLCSEDQFHKSPRKP